MKLDEVIESLLEERNLDREKVIAVIRDGVLTAYRKKFPDLAFQARYNTKTGQVEVLVEKTVVSGVPASSAEIPLRKARIIDASAEIGGTVLEAFDQSVGRIEMSAARQFIAGGIRGVEQQAVYDEFKDKEGTIINGRVHKRERAGYVVKMGETMAFLPKSCTIPEENLRIGYPARALLKEVLPSARGDHQLILDRASSQFVQKLLELEIPEIFEGVVEIRQVVRVPGYKSKVVVSSNSKEIDPVGTCVGVGGVRIRPILKELGQEKVDLIEFTENLEQLVAEALKPAEIDRVVVDEDHGRATVWLAQDQRSFAIGKQGQNIALVSRLTGLHVQLQEDTAQKKLAAGVDELEAIHGQSENKTEE
ncbi:MAG: transcription termination/antitermination protein NusA [Candidatus Dependentiae bacterium]|nr:transcription termination/antitermination protein NusA [Candidatus Dependentiae bacterium]